jgi:hypothetical protein
VFELLHLTDPSDHSLFGKYFTGLLWLLIVSGHLESLLSHHSEKNFGSVMIVSEQYKA